MEDQEGYLVLASTTEIFFIFLNFEKHMLTNK
jgi:hypothetical protein